MTMSNYVPRCLRIALACAALAAAGPSLAAIDLPGGDTEGNGDFNLSPFVYGMGGSAYLSTLLSVNELSGMAQPADHVLGTDLAYSYTPPSGLGTSVVDLSYSFTNTSSTDNWTDLRFVVYLDPNGNNTSFLDTVSMSLPPKVSGEFDKWEIGADAFLAPIKPTIQANRGVMNGNDACSPAACDVDFAFEWDRAALAPGESWIINFRMVDDPALVAGGRYLVAASDETLLAGNPVLVPEPESYAMLLAGLGLIVWWTRRKAAAPQSASC